ncbi:hypothetical protein [Ruminiclostridium papyrosolvens]|uniref:Uncharacterized protein n=1 Tax=Ruminiclostridium papyrosolvens C7 TaxID=1330534 RepID=U4QWS8_9FIRM|nr:hypothetical protein [Ruminiclostridium papyrosolvens]EPR07743.1 hypothetical protein L323_19695 [Ruminiclostridium papyrosolvens C7]
MENLRCAILAQDGTTVENIIIADQSFAYSNGLIICGTIPVAIGDSYKDGYFYRDGQKLIVEKTEIEKLQKMVDTLILDNLNMQAQIDTLITSNLQEV